ncbi:MAG: O-antigen ligase family protein [Coriobacteriia bacterium]|nr:O-antigen ligase family protein [Coriobacteriia bacterium]
MTRIANAAAWVAAGMVFLVAVVWTNLTGLGISAQQFTYDDVALPRFAVALVGVALAWVLVSWLVWRGNPLGVDVTWALLGGLSVWALVSAALAGSPIVWLGQSERLEGAVTVVLYALLFGLGLQLGRSKRFVRRIGGALVLGSALLSVHGLLQTLKLDPTNYLVSGSSLYLGSAFASLSNPNFLAALLVLALPIAIGLALTAENLVVRIAWWVCAVLALAALYATYSQGAWLAAVIELAVGLALWLAARQRASDAVAEDATSSSTPARRRMNPALIAGLVVVAGVVLIVAVTTFATSRGLRLWGSSLTETSSGRILLMQTSANAAGAKPILGWGPDSFLAAFRLERPDRYMEVFGETATNSNAHNWVLQYATTTGVIGALLLLSALAFGLWRARPWRTDDATAALDIMQCAVWAGALGFSIQAVFNVAMLASTVPFWLLLGAISAPRARRVSVQTWAGAAAVAVFGALLVAGAYGSYRLIAADSTFLAAREVYYTGDFGASHDLALEAAALNPLSVKYSRAAAQASAENAVLMAGADGFDDESVRTAYDLAAEDFARTLVVAPNDYAALAWLAGLQARIGERLGDEQLRAAAQRTAEEAAALDRTHTHVQRVLAGETDKGAAREALSAPGLP